MFLENLDFARNCWPLQLPIRKANVPICPIAPDSRPPPQPLDLFCLTRSAVGQNEFQRNQKSTMANSILAFVSIYTACSVSQKGYHRHAFSRSYFGSRSLFSFRCYLHPHYHDHASSVHPSVAERYPGTHRATHRGGYRANIQRHCLRRRI